MGKQVASSGLLAKYGQGLITAVETHKNDEIDYGNLGDLPAGAEGVARLTDIRFSQYKSGPYFNAKNPADSDYFFFAQGSVLTPKSIKGDGVDVKCAGKFTRIGPEPVCATPAKAGTTPSDNARLTQEDHIAWILNELKKLLGEDFDQKQITAQNMEVLAAALKKSGPCFSYRTWAFPKKEIVNRNGKFFVVAGGKDQCGPFSTLEQLKADRIGKYAGQPSRVNHSWNGACPEPADDGNDGVTASGAAAGEPPVGKIEPAASDTSSDNSPTSESAPFVGSGDELTDLANIATDNDTESQAHINAATKMLGMALEVGISEEDFSSTSDWFEAAELVRSARAAGDAGENAVDYVALGATAEGDSADSESAITALTEAWEAKGNACDADFNSMSWSEVAAKLAESNGESMASTIVYKVKECGFFLPKTNNPKTKKPFSKPIEVEIVAVKGDKLDLLNMDDRKTKYTDIPATEFQAS